MSDKLLPFAFEDNLVRVRVDEHGDPWFVAKDVCRVLDLGNNREAVSNLDDDEKITVSNPDGNPREGIPHQLTLVSESGLYALSFRSRKSEARRIRKWVTAEVLPSIRKTGGYTLPGRGVAMAPASLPLPPEALCLRPHMRERLWNDAMQAARLDNAGTEAAGAWFAELCRMMVAKPPRSDARQLLHEFMDECLEKARGRNAPFHRIYETLESWWRERGLATPPPGKKITGDVLLERFQKFKSNCMVYRDCLVKEATG
jgi:prophage antirepressor-like protein